jgi:hypothetical protein
MIGHHGRFRFQPRTRFAWPELQDIKAQAQLHFIASHSSAYADGQMIAYLYKANTIHKLPIS